MFSFVKIRHNVALVFSYRCRIHLKGTTNLRYSTAIRGDNLHRHSKFCCFNQKEKCFLKSYSPSPLAIYNPLLTTVRYKSGKKKNQKKEQKKYGSDEETDDEDEEVDTDEESLSDLEEDPNEPLGYKQLMVYSSRADALVAKSLGVSHKDVEKMFYNSQFYHDGKVLLKKAKQIHEGDHIDIVESGADLSNKNANIKVQRVKVVKYLEKKTKSGKPITVVRVWKRPFEIAINEVSY